MGQTPILRGRLLIFRTDEAAYPPGQLFRANLKNPVSLGQNWRQGFLKQATGLRLMQIWG